MSRIQVLIESEGEREAVVSLLEERYEIITDERVRAVDLYLVDDHSLPESRAALRERTRIDERALPGTGSGSVGIIDEVPVAPLDTETIVWRLDNLLTRRDTTRNLVHRNEQLRQREQELERYKTYVQQSNDIITALDSSGLVQYQSPAIERVLGYEQTELVGTNAFDLLHPDDRSSRWDAFEELVTEPESTMATEGRFQDIDGEYRWLSLRATNHLDDDSIEAILLNSHEHHRTQAPRAETTADSQTND